MKKLMILVLAGLILWPGSGLFLKAAEAQEQLSLTRRPSTKRFLYDYAGILTDQKESTERYLKILNDNYGIEAVIVSIPALEEALTVEQIAIALFDNWKIGRENGRGLILLLKENTKEVRLDVSLELEDVFTDAFCGYIADKQLRANFLSGNIGVAMIAVMEELENRAQIKAEGQYTTDFIKQLDDKLLAGGGGVRRDLTKYEKQEATGIAAEYPAGATPDEAWQTMVRKWENGVTNSNLGVYTEITKLAYRDFENEGAAAQREYYEKWGTKPYEVKQNEDYAVISFGEKEGWDNAPFLYSRTDEGWKVDIVHQRRYIRMGNAPKWGVERADFPHMDLLGGYPHWMNQDIPFEEEDRYTIAKDREWASEILRLEEQNRNNPDDFETLVALGRLNVLTSMRPNHYFPLLNKAKALNPDDPRPYKYLAVAHVNSNYQFQSAIKELKEFLRREPESVFGHSFLGYLYLEEGEYNKAIEELEQALKLAPENCYALCKLSRTYGRLYLKSSALDPRRGFYKSRSNEMYGKARHAPDVSRRRVGWLRSWLQDKKILERR